MLNWQVELVQVKLDIDFQQAIYVPADDLTDPAPATTFAHLDATTVLSRGISELGIYPAVDPLDSTSRIMDPNVVGMDHYEIARATQKILQVNWCAFYASLTFIVQGFVNLSLFKFKFNLLLIQ